MKVQKRNNNFEEVSFDKILNRIKLLCNSEEFSKKLDIDPTIIAQKVCSELYDGVTTSELDNLAAEIAATMTTTHPDYTQLAARISVSNLHKNLNRNLSVLIDFGYEISFDL